MFEVRQFFSELKRRHVFKVGLVYLAFAIALIAFAGDIEDALNVLPPWTSALIIVLAVVGFPIALISAWALELTPQGVVLDRGPYAEASERPPQPSSELASIAVLPFRSASGSSEEEFLATSIPLEINNTLSRVQRLRIVSGQSSRAHSQDDKDLKTISTELAVGYIISGSVSRVHDSVRVIAELYDAATDTLLWTERFNVRADRVFDATREIAEEAAMAFGGERLRLEVEQACSGQTADQAAWELVQRARAYLLSYTPESVGAAVSLLQRAVELDPDYAVGHAQLALVTAEKTLNAIDDDPESDCAVALSAVARAQALAPNDPIVLRNAGVVQAYCGNNLESIALLKRATGLAPYDLGAWGYLGWPLVGTGRTQDLIELHEILDRLLAHGTKHPGYSYWLFHKSVAFCCDGEQTEQALDFGERALESQARFALGWMHCANLHGQRGDLEAAARAVDRSLQINPRLTSGYYAALIERLSDTASVIEHRTDGLRSAGLLGGQVS